MGSRGTHPTLGRQCTFTSPDRHTTSNVYLGCVGTGGKSSSDATCDQDLYGVDETRPAVDWNETSSPTGTANTARPCARRQSSAQAAVSVNSEVTTANNETDAPTTSGQSSLEPASAVQHFKSSLVKTASPQTVPHLQSEETT